MSHKNIKLTSVDRIFTRLKGKMPLTEEGDIIEWIGDALEAIGSINQYRPAVCFSEVKNGRVLVPKDCHSIIQLARNNQWMPKMPASIFAPGDAVSCLGAIRKPITVSDYGDLDKGCGCYLNDCYPEDRNVPIFSVTLEFGNWIGSAIYKKAFSPIRLTNHSFFLSSVCKEDNYDEIYHSCKDEYDIVDGKMLRFSFQEGQVAIAYNQIQMGEDGNPMIPDQISYITAIVNYVLWQWYSREFYSGREGAERKMDKAELEWIWYCGQARNFSLMPSGEDEHQNLMEQRGYMIPPRNKYFGFFGTLSNEEKRRF